jgi:hypothetical protein
VRAALEVHSALMLLRLLCSERLCNRKAVVVYLEGADSNLINLLFSFVGFYSTVAVIQE